MDGITLKSLLVKSSVLHRTLSFVKFEVPQRQQLASERTPLTLFAPAPSTISFVPLTRNLSLADPSPYPVRGWTGLSEATATRFPVLRTTKCDAFSEARRTKNRLLRYGIRIRCAKQPPGVREAFSKALGAKNRLLLYGMEIRCSKRPPGVRDAFSKASRTAPVTPNAFSKARRTADSTDCGQPPAAPDASSEACRAKSCTCRTERILEGAKNNLRSEVSRHKKRVTSKSIKTFQSSPFFYNNQSDDYQKLNFSMACTR